MTAAVHLENLVKIYRSGVPAVRGLSLRIEQGRFYGLLGANGAGKSTMLGILCGLVNKTSGRVVVCGHDIDQDPAGVKRCIGMVPQEFNFSIFERVEDILSQQAGYYGLPRPLAKERVQKYLNLVGLSAKASTMARHLSGGQKRRLMIARAMLHEPAVLILDEPTAGVDVEARRQMWLVLNAMHRAGTTIILTTHYLEEVEQHAGEVGVIHQGAMLFSGSLSDFLARGRVQRYLLETRNRLPDPLPRLPGVQLQRVQEQRLAVDLQLQVSLNTLLRGLDDAKIEVASIRPRENLVESLFLQFTGS